MNCTPASLNLVLLSAKEIFEVVSGALLMHTSIFIVNEFFRGAKVGMFTGAICPGSVALGMPFHDERFVHHLWQKTANSSQGICILGALKFSSDRRKIKSVEENHTFAGFKTLQ